MKSQKKGVKHLHVDSLPPQCLRIILFPLFLPLAKASDILPKLDLRGRLTSELHLSSGRWSASAAARTSSVKDMAWATWMMRRPMMLKASRCIIPPHNCHPLGPNVAHHVLWGRGKGQEAQQVREESRGALVASLWESGLCHRPAGLHLSDSQWTNYLEHFWNPWGHVSVFIHFSLSSPSPA